MAALFLLPGAMPEGKKKEKAYYVMTDRNSPRVWYFGPRGDSLFFSKEERTWCMKWFRDTLARHEEGTSFHFNEKWFRDTLAKHKEKTKTSFTFDEKKHYPDMIQRKHRSFLDSIGYFNEIWVTDSIQEIIKRHNKKSPTYFLPLPEEIRDAVYYLIDVGTIKNDSIMIYRTKISTYAIEYD